MRRVCRVTSIIRDGHRGAKRHSLRLSHATPIADDTPVKLLSPGAGKTKTARFWAYGRDERSWAGDTPQAAWYQFSPDRKV